MAKVYGDRVQMTTATTGTGTITLGSASSGYLTFGDYLSNSDTTDILIVDGTAWEVARDCTYTTSGTTITRGTFVKSSTGSALNLSGSATVAINSRAAVTQSVYDLLMDVAANKIIGAASAGAATEIDCTAAGRAILDDADAAAQRTTLGIRDKLVQRVSTESTSTFSTTTTIPLDNTIPQNTEGGELITLAITPTSTGNKLRVAVHCYTSASAIATTAIALFRDSTADAIKASFLHTGAGAGYIHRIDVVFEVTPGSTSSETYKFRIGPTSAATVQANQAASTAYFSTSDVIMMEIMEVAP